MATRIYPPDRRPPSVLADLRNGQGLTQEELAHRAGLCRVTIHNIERGRSTPSRSTVRVLATALDVEYDTLAGSLRGTRPVSS